jgi:hypothetical protein
MGFKLSLIIHLRLPYEISNNFNIHCDHRLCDFLLAGLRLPVQGLDNCLDGVQHEAVHQIFPFLANCCQVALIRRI